MGKGNYTGACVLLRAVRMAAGRQSMLLRFKSSVSETGWIAFYWTNDVYSKHACAE